MFLKRRRKQQATQATVSPSLVETKMTPRALDRIPSEFNVYIIQFL